MPTQISLKSEETSGSQTIAVSESVANVARLLNEVPSSKWLELTQDPSGKAIAVMATRIVDIEEV